MFLKKRFIQFVREINLQESARVLHWKFIFFKRFLRNIDKAILQRYFKEYKISKLHIGSGGHFIDGWLNAELFPSQDEFRMDATKEFPFNSSVFDFIFSEHMIEHVSFPQGLYMLSECRRVLKPGGTLRISTPDLKFLIKLYRDNLSEKEKRYIDFMINNYGDKAFKNGGIFVLNMFFRLWGHKFLYDKKTLQNALKTAGFSTFVECEIGKSKKEDLKNLENINRMPEEFLKMESMVFEAT